jgi:hypothetical protein
VLPTQNDQLDHCTTKKKQLKNRRKLIMFLLSISISVVMHKEKEEMIHIHHSSHDSYRTRELGIFENGLLDSDVFLQVSFFSSLKLMMKDAAEKKLYQKCFHLVKFCDGGKEKFVNQVKSIFKVFGKS